MSGILKKAYYSFLKLIPNRMIAHIETMRMYHKFYNDRSPEYFGEKLQWVKLHADLDRYSTYSDKYAVREYVRETIGEEYLIRLIGVYDSPDDIPFESLPERFALKVNHGSGYNIICKDKSRLDIKEVKKQLGKWLSEDYASIKGEEQYRNIPRKILCEEYMEDSSGGLLDYKYFCFNGEIRIIEVCFDRFGEFAIDYYDENWKKLPIANQKHKNSSVGKEKPAIADEMAKIVKKLSAPFPFVRTDIYVVNNKIYFGELTFIPGSGSNPFSPLEVDKEVAGWIDLSKYARK